MCILPPTFAQGLPLMTLSTLQHKDWAGQNFKGPRIQSMLQPLTTLLDRGRCAQAKLRSEHCLGGLHLKR